MGLVTVMTFCDVCDEETEERLTVKVSDSRGKILATKRLYYACARNIDPDLPPEPGVCDSCGARIPWGHTRCLGCAKDLQG